MFRKLFGDFKNNQNARDNCYYTDVYWGEARNCNFKYKIPNLSGHIAHLFTRKLDAKLKTKDILVTAKNNKR